MKGVLKNFAIYFNLKIHLFTISNMIMYQHKGTSKNNLFLPGVFNPFHTYNSLGNNNDRIPKYYKNIK